MKHTSTARAGGSETDDVSGQLTCNLYSYIIYGAGRSTGQNSYLAYKE